MATVPERLMDVAQYSVRASRDERRDAVPRLWQPAVPVLPRERPRGSCRTGHAVLTVLKGRLRRRVGQTPVGLTEVL